MTDFTNSRQLFSHYCRGEISAEQLRVLESSLREDADLRNEFIEYMNVDSGLGQLAALSKGELAEIEALELEAEAVREISGESLKPPVLRDSIFGTYRSIALFVAVVAATLLLAFAAWFRGSPEKVSTSVATLCAITGIKIDTNDFDGEDTLAAWFGDAPHVRTKPLLWKTSNPRSEAYVRIGQWKLLHPTRKKHGPPQLYDIVADPAESSDVAAQHPDIVKRLSEVVQSWNATLPTQYSKTKDKQD